MTRIEAVKIFMEFAGHTKDNVCCSKRETESVDEDLAAVLDAFGITQEEINEAKK